MRRGLVIEGGGMKAAYANGVLTAFEQAGYRPWDYVIGTSAGGALAAWYSAGQSEWAEQTWPYARDPRVLNYRRWITQKGPLLDHEALLDIVYVEEHPLDVKALKKAPWPVVVTAVDVDSGVPVYPDIRKSDPIAWLKATGRLPIASGNPVEIDGCRYLDGGIVDPVPVQHAIEVGRCDHITLVTNKALGKKRPDPRLFVEFTARRYPNLRRGLEDHQELKWNGVNAVLHPSNGISGAVIFPSTPTKLGRFTRDMGAIRAAISLGRQDGDKYLQNAP